MKFAALAILGVFTVTACDQRPGEETGRAVDAADTVITSTQDVDTTIITQDTTVEVDTIQQDSHDPAFRDTLQQPNPSAGAPAEDTGLTDTTQM